MNRLKLWRLQERLTQTAAASRLGLGVSTYSLLEVGRLRPSVAQLNGLRDFFGFSPERLFEAVNERIEVNT